MRICWWWWWWYPRCIHPGLGGGRIRNTSRIRSYIRIRIGRMVLRVFRRYGTIVVYRCSRCCSSTAKGRMVVVAMGMVDGSTTSTGIRRCVHFGWYIIHLRRGGW